ncbi:MAG: DUF362 domain-containing protein [Chloroflexi bacterium]|nr:DUF362 domain-containing protein [Chloroflexota bacterium]
MADKAFAVRAVHCDHRATDDEIYERICAATDPLHRSWAKIEQARQVVIKVNMAMPLERIRRVDGRRQELVDDAVCRAVLRRLRERTTARLVATDTLAWTPEAPERDFSYRHILGEFGVDWVDANRPPMELYDVPGGGHIFRRYKLTSCLAESDAMVSLATLKTHLFQGVTLSLKNLFGLPPMAPHGRTRGYFHHIIRLSYVLPDLGRIAQPCLNIIDGLVGQSGREWDGEARVANVLIAGDHTIATDACGAWLMGHDPTTDWPESPFIRDRSALRIAAEHGFGTVDLGEIDFQCEVQRPVAHFAPDQLDPAETIARWRETTCEQALFYRDHQRDLVGRYAGEFLMLQDGEVIWHGPDPSTLPSRRILSGERKDSAIWLKLADPEEREGEHFEVYERELARMRESRRAR